MKEIQNKQNIALLLGLFFTLALFVGSFLVVSGVQADIKYTSSNLLKTINSTRSQYGLSKLQLNPQLQQVAQDRAEVITKEQRFSHTTIDNRTLQDFLIAADYNYQRGGENLGLDFILSEDLMTAWLQSPGHKSNILTPEYTDTGIVVQDIEYHGQTTTLVVHIFGQSATKKQPSLQSLTDSSIFHYSLDLIKKLTLADIIATILQSV